MNNYWVAPAPLYDLFVVTPNDAALQDFFLIDQNEAAEKFSDALAYTYYNGEINYIIGVDDERQN